MLFRSGQVQFVYQPTTPATSFTTQVGINGSVSTDFLIRTTTANWAATTAGTINTATCQFSSTVFPASGLTFTFSPPPTQTFSWSPSIGLSSTNISNPKAAPPFGTTIYTVTVSIPQGCTKTATVSIQNLGASDPQPTVTNDTKCAGSLAHLAASGVSTLRWYDAATTGNLKHVGSTWDSAWSATTIYWVESFKIGRAHV